MNRTRVKWRLLLTVLFIALALAVADLLVVTMSCLLLIAAGILFGIFLNGISSWLVRHTPLPYQAAYGLVVVLLVALLAGGFYYAGSQVAQQAAELTSELRSAGQQWTDELKEYDWARQYLQDDFRVQQVLTRGSAGAEVMQGVQSALWGVTGIIVILFVGLYIAYDPELYKTGLLKLIPPNRRQRWTEVLDKLYSALGYWIIGRLISMSIIGVFTAIGLWLLNVPLPVTLGVIAALLTFIPNIGPILAAVPQALLALKVGPTTVLYVILFNIVLQTLESYLITPVVQRIEVTLPPVLTIFAQLLMAVLVGVIGIVMAAPLTAATMVLVQMLYIRDRLGDPAPGRLSS